MLLAGLTDHEQEPDEEDNVDCVRDGSCDRGQDDTDALHVQPTIRCMQRSEDSKAIAIGSKSR